MRQIPLVIGATLVLVGGIWIVQGAGLLKGSFMTDHSFWAWMGVLAILLGLPIIRQGFRRS